MSVLFDSKVPFAAYFIKARTKEEQRKHIADHALSWLRVQRLRGARGAIMIDIDDTIMDKNERVQDGFEWMQAMYQEMSLTFPIHVVTARPDDDHAYAIKMLHARGFCIASDRLWMLPSAHYGKSTSYVENFKWNCYLQIGKVHGGVVARFGDKLWDVAHYDSIQTYLKHIEDKHCYAFRDPMMRGTASFKLPGLKY